jgi:hypothetical protein
MKHFELATVGGGLASARAIRAFRDAGGEGAVGLLSADTALPSHRPPLSKGYLRGETLVRLIEARAPLAAALGRGALSGSGE